MINTQEPSGKPGQAPPVLIPRAFVRATALALSLPLPCTRHPPPSGMRPTFFTSRCTMWPGRLALMLCGSRFVSPFGSMNFRRFRPSCAKSRVMVRRLTGVPACSSSNAIRDADHLCPRRIDSICCTRQPGVADGCRIGDDERSRRPVFPNRLYLLTHFEAVAREIPISAATWEIGRVRQRSIRRRRPSGERGALACVGEVMTVLSDLRSAPSPGPHARPRRSRCGSRWPLPRSGCGRWGAA